MRQPTRGCLESKEWKIVEQALGKGYVLFFTCKKNLSTAVVSSTPRLVWCSGCKHRLLMENALLDFEEPEHNRCGPSLGTPETFVHLCSCCFVCVPALFNWCNTDKCVQGEDAENRSQEERVTETVREHRLGCIYLGLQTVGGAFLKAFADCKVKVQLSAGSGCLKRWADSDMRPVIAGFTSSVHTW